MQQVVPLFTCKNLWAPAQERRDPVVARFRHIKCAAGILRKSVQERRSDTPLAGVLPGLVHHKALHRHRRLKGFEMRALFTNVPSQSKIGAASSALVIGQGHSSDVRWRLVPARSSVLCNMTAQTATHLA